MDNRRKQSWAFKDETGNIYGRLTVISNAGKRSTPSGQQKQYWDCRCECGKEKCVSGDKLRNGTTKSCGCLKGDSVRERCSLSLEEIQRRETEPRPCTKCGVIYPPSEFQHIRRHHCHKCVAEWTRNYNKGKHHRTGLRDRYGLTPEMYAELLASQGGGCAICGDRPEGNKHFPVDHDHDLNKGDVGFVRGILCGLCNRGIGQFKERVDLIDKASAYLKRNVINKESA